METKTLSATVKAVKDSGEFEAILSMPTLDRDGEIIDAYAFEPLPAKIPIDVDHGVGTEKTVGSGVPFYDTDGTLWIRGTFASTPLGQNTRTLVTEGHVGFMSVMYMNAVYENGDDGIPHLRKGELLNAAITPVPSNRQAAILAAKSAEKAVRSAKDHAAIQAIFNNVVQLGAQCPACAEKSAPQGTAKSADTDPEPAAAPAAAAPAEVDVARRLVSLALAQAEIALM